MTLQDPRIDVVILTWNDGELLGSAVASALGSEDVELEVIVVDNGSEPPAVAPDPRVQLIRSETNLGVSAGRNLGVRSGAAPVVCLLDSDARLHPDTLAVLLGHLLADPEVAMVVPVFDDQAPEASAGPAPTAMVKVQRMLGRRSDYHAIAPAGAGKWEVDFGIGACQVFRRSVFDEVGGIDERYFYGPEDVDFCLRIRERGWRIVQLRDARCVHPPRRRFRRSMNRSTLRHGLAVVRHLWRHRRFRSEIAP